MRYGWGLLLIGAGGILAFAVTANTDVFNLHTAGYVLILTGVLAMVLPRHYAGWVGRRLFVRRYERRRGDVEQVTYPPYEKNPPVRASLPPGETKVIEDVYEE